MLIVNKNILSTLSRLEGTESVRALNADINADISITVTAMTTNSRLFLEIHCQCEQKMVKKHWVEKIYRAFLNIY